MPKMMKKAQQIKTMLPMGLRDVMSVSTTSFSPGALLITLEDKKIEKMIKMERKKRKEIKQLPSQPEGAQRPEQPENAEDSQDFCSARHGHHDINEGHEDKETIQDVPAAPEVGFLPQVETHGHHLKTESHIL